LLTAIFSHVFIRLRSGQGIRLSQTLGAMFFWGGVGAWGEIRECRLWQSDIQRKEKIDTRLEDG
jgi:hypothetical protein